MSFPQPPAAPTTPYGRRGAVDPGRRSRYRGQKHDPTTATGFVTRYPPPPTPQTARLSRTPPDDKDGASSRHSRIASPARLPSSAGARFAKNPQATGSARGRNRAGLRGRGRAETKTARPTRHRPLRARPTSSETLATLGPESPLSEATASAPLLRASTADAVDASSSVTRGWRAACSHLRRVCFAEGRLERALRFGTALGAYCYCRCATALKKPLPTTWPRRVIPLDIRTLCW